MTPAVRYRHRRETTDIIVHDSHTPPSVASAEDYLRAYGRELGLLDIGYHYVIERYGYVRACRPVDLVGSHTPGHNLKSIGICLAGGQDEYGNTEDNFTPPQMEVLGLLVAHLRSRYPSIARVVGHTEIQRYRHRELQCPAFSMHKWREATGIPHPTR